jgi:hypothetical protein
LVGAKICCALSSPSDQFTTFASTPRPSKISSGTVSGCRP